MDDQHGQKYQAQQTVEFPTLQPRHIKNGALHKRAMQPARLARNPELTELGEKDHDRQTVYKTQHHRIRHHADELTQSQHPGKNLQQAHQHDGDK